MRILVTGDDGYIGRHVVAAANAHPEVDLVAGIELKRGVDVCDISQVMRVFADVQPHVVIHLAGLADVAAAKRMPNRYWMTNVGGTAILATAAKASGVQRFVFASTLTVGQGVYGRTKEAAECVLNGFDIDGAFPRGAINLRLSNVAGEQHQSRTHLFPNIVRALQGGLPFRQTCSAAIRDYVHVKDVAQAFIHFATLPIDFLPHSLEIGTGIATSIDDVLNEYRHQSGQPLPRIHDMSREGEPLRLVADTSYAAELGWRAQHTLTDIVRSTL